MPADLDAGQCAALPQEQPLGAASPPHGELQYLRQVKHILQFGHKKQDRTGTGTLSVFGMQARYSLRGEALSLLRSHKSAAGVPFPARGMAGREVAGADALPPLNPG